jgi:transposase
MIWRVLNVEDWAEIRRLNRSEGMSIKSIARVLGVSRNTVRQALRSVEPPKYVRAPTGSAMDPFIPRVRECLTVDPWMPASVIAERVGWERSMSVFRARIREIRPQFAPADPASRTTYEPGELAQCDLWFPASPVPLGAGHVDHPPVLVMVCGYSRVIMARMIPSRHSGDLIAGHWALLSGLGAVPKALVWDNEGAVGRWAGGKPVLTEAFQAFRGTLGITVIQNKPRDPESKGLVERANGYLETSFLPGRVFTGPGDFNTQLSEWLVRANTRHHRRIECRPIDRLEADRSAMVALPPVAPATGWRYQVRLPRDHYVRVDTCDYSVDPAAIGRRIEVAADLEHVTATLDGVPMARHERSWAPHQTITDPAHAAAAALMRRGHQRAACAPTSGDPVEIRDLSRYDVMFGLAAADGTVQVT